MADDRRLWLWNLEGVNPEAPLMTTRGWGEVAAFSRRGDRLMCAENNEGWIERDVASGEIQRAHATALRVARFFASPTDDVVVVQARSPIQTDGRLEWWSGSADQPTATRRIGSMSEWHFSADGRVLSGFDQNLATLLDARTGQPLKSEVTSMAAALRGTADGHWITARPEGSELRIRVDNRFVCVPHEPGGLRSPIIFPNGRSLGAIGGGGVILWDIHTCDEVRRIRCSMAGDNG